MADGTMEAVVFRGRGDVAVQRVPMPKLLHPTDAIVRVKYSAICGSDLHVYRGREDCPLGTIMGHEFCGTIHEIGSNIQRHAVGDPVFSPFTTCCGSCFYCQNGLSSRCESGQLYGTADLPGTQAEYVRVPLADATLRAEPVGLLRNVMPLLLADVFPTGYHAATSAFDMIPRGVVGSAYENVVIVGCGPVGLSAVVTTTHLDSKVYKPKQIFAADTVPSRLALAEAMGAQPLNTSAGTDKAVKAVREATQGRGADIIVELVGMKLALRMAFDMLRPGGILVSLGVHDEEFPWSLAEAYDKNLRMQFGRCPVWSIQIPALHMLMKTQHLFAFMEENIMPLADAAEGYELFDQRQTQKVVLDTSQKPNP